MAEIIKIDFQKKKKIENEKIEENEKPNRNMGPLFPIEGEFESPYALAQYFRQEVLEHNFRENLAKIKNLTFSPESMKEAKRLVSSYSGIQLVDMLVNSTQIDWVKKPAFYQALLNEIEERKEGKGYF